MTLRLATSYLLDWAVVIAIATVGGVLKHFRGYHRPFPLNRYEIAYPTRRDIIPTGALIIFALIAPATLILILSVVFRSKNAPTHYLKQSKWRMVLWKVHVGWLGLGAALATTLFVTAGLKDMVGKPRPDLLARCHPDLDAVAKYVVGGLRGSLDANVTPLVSSAICQQTNKRFLDDGFAAFPSGHSSFSCAGLIYFSLWLSARLSVTLPYLDRVQPPITSEPPPKHPNGRRSAPPLWQMFLVLVPVGVAVFVCASRYTDFHESAVDIFAGAFIGTFFGWASFRLYHMPVRRGGNISTWDPRLEEYPHDEHDDDRHGNDTDTNTTAVGNGTSTRPSKVPKSRKRNQFGETYTLRELEAGLSARDGHQQTKTVNADESILPM